MSSGMMAGPGIPPGPLLAPSVALSRGFEFPAQAQEPVPRDRRRDGGRRWLGSGAVARRFSAGRAAPDDPLRRRQRADGPAAGLPAAPCARLVSRHGQPARHAGAGVRSGRAIRRRARQPGQADAAGPRPRRRSGRAGDRRPAAAAAIHGCRPASRTPQCPPRWRTASTTPTGTKAWIGWTCRSTRCCTASVTNWRPGRADGAAAGTNKRCL